MVIAHRHEVAKSRIITVQLEIFAVRKLQEFSSSDNHSKTLSMKICQVAGVVHVTFSKKTMAITFTLAAPSMVNTSTYKDV